MYLAHSILHAPSKSSPRTIDCNSCSPIGYGQGSSRLAHSVTAPPPGPSQALTLYEHHYLDRVPASYFHSLGGVFRASASGDVPSNCPKLCKPDLWVVPVIPLSFHCPPSGLDRRRHDTVASNSIPTAFSSCISPSADCWTSHSFGHPRRAHPPRNWAAFKFRPIYNTGLTSPTTIEYADIQNSLFFLAERLQLGWRGAYTYVAIIRSLWHDFRCRLSSHIRYP